MTIADPLLSKDPAVVAAALKNAIASAAANDRLKDAEQGVNYYNAKHDILDAKVFYVNDAGHVTEDKFASNIRIAHPFLTELIDQKVSYLLSNPVEVTVEDDEQFQERLDEYFDEDFQVSLQNLLTEASQKGAEYLFARTTSEDKLKFQVADMRQTFPVYDEDGNVRAIVRAYEVFGVTDENRQPIKVHRAEVWDEQNVTFYVSMRERNYELDTSIAPNPRKHVMAQQVDEDGQVVEEGKLAGRSYARIPFYRYSNTSAEATDLRPVKAIIDDYDTMNAYLSNNLQDFTDVLYVVRGYSGNDLDTLRQNIRAKKTVGVSEGGDVDIRAVPVPVEGRKVKMEIDRENIYRFGMGFDSSQIGDGNITNVVIKSRYALLNMKANKTESRLRACLRWVAQMVVDDINRRYGTSYDAAAVEFELTRDQLVSATDDAQVEFTEANARATAINYILAAASRLDDETVLKLLCEVLDVDPDEVQKALDAALGGAPDSLVTEPGLPGAAQPASAALPVPGGDTASTLPPGAGNAALAG